MNKKTETLKTERVKSYFIDATKEIILNEGVENATVRSIAKKAGYSVSTVYQYFNDLNALLLDVKKAFIEDLGKKVTNKVVFNSHSVDDIKAQNHEFIDFFLNQPNVYPFLYMNVDTTNMGNFDKLEFNEEYYQLFNGYVNYGLIKKEDVPNIAKIIIYSMNGMLQIYFTNHGLSKNEIYNDLDNIIDYLFNNK